MSSFAHKALCVTVATVIAVSGEADAQTCTSLSSYYPSSVTSKFTSESGSTLKATLAGLISSPYKELPYTSTSTDTWDCVEHADEYDSSNIVEIYTRDPSPKSDHSGWNREHLWPQSRGVREIAARTDCHGLRASDQRVNSARGSLHFGYCEGCEEAHPEAPLAKKNSDLFEPPDLVKGDIARAILYLATRYYQDLTLTDNPTQSNDFGYLSDIIQWHLNDPVSPEEIERNNAVCLYQLNRNPYVDHPCLVGQVWGGGAPACTTSTPPPTPNPTSSGATTGAPTASSGGSTKTPTSGPTSGGGGAGTGSSLFFSQYLEGSSNNKAVQIANPTSSSVSLENIEIRLYFNGQSSPTTIFLSGTIAAGSRYTLCHTALSSSRICDDTVSNLQFNGDDAVALFDTSSDTLLDTVGTIGSDPGSAWTICDASQTTKDHTLTRKSFVTGGNGGDWSADRRCDEWNVGDQNTWNAILGRTGETELITIESSAVSMAGIIGASVGVAACVTLFGVVVWKKRQVAGSATGDVQPRSNANDPFEEFRIKEGKELDGEQQA